jgi:hypothetical protein
MSIIREKFESLNKVPDGVEYHSEKNDYRHIRTDGCWTGLRHESIEINAKWIGFQQAIQFIESDECFSVMERLAAALYAAVHAGKLNEANRITTNGYSVEIGDLLDQAEALLGWKMLNRDRKVELGEQS